MSHDTQAVRQGERRLARKLAKALRTVGKEIAAKIEKLHKSAEEDERDAVESADWAPIARAAAAELADVARDGAQQGLKLLLVDDDSILEQTFDSAVDWAKARAAELVGKSWDEDGELIDNPDADMAITDTMRLEIRARVADAIQNGDSAKELGDSIEELGGFSEAQALLIARTECLLPETPVDAAVVRAAYRRRYEGDVVEIWTAKGRKLTATPNHPMLTRRGWVAAGELTQFDDLLCDARQQDSGARRNEYVNGRPPTIREVFCALSYSRPLQRDPGSRLDFHGDGMDRDVDTVRLDGVLPVGTFAEISKPSHQDLFAEADEARAPFCHSCGRLLAINPRPCLCLSAERNAGGLDASGDRPSLHPERLGQAAQGLSSGVPEGNLVTGEIAAECRSDPTSIVPQPGRGTSVAHGGARFVKCKGDTIHRGGEIVGDLGAGEPALVQGPHLRDIQRRASLEECSVASTAPVDAGSDHVSSEPIDGNMVPRCDDQGPVAAQVVFDRVVSVVRFRYSGHVFNLETPHGYFCVAGGAYTGNTIRAHSQGQLSAMRASGVVEQKAWSTAGEEDVCDDCQENEDEGPIPLEDDFPSGDDAPPGHPACRCAVVAAIGDGDDEESDEDEDDTEEADED